MLYYGALLEHNGRVSNSHAPIANIRLAHIMLLILPWSNAPESYSLCSNYAPYNSTLLL